jgi:pyruvate-formate lyase
MQIKKTREEFLNLYQTLSQLGNLKGVKFAYIIAKNKEVIKPELVAIQEAGKMKDNYKEYDKERVELNEKYALKEKDGKPVIKDENYQIKDKETFEKALKELQEKHKEAIDEREAQIKEVNDLVKEEIEMDLKTLPLAIVPEDITVRQMESLSIIITE